MAKVVDISDPPQQKRKLIDRAGALAARLAKVKPLIEELAGLKKTFASWLDKDPAHFDRVFHGRFYQVKVSAKEYKREITDMEAVYKRMGHEQFLAHCSLAFKVLDVFWPEAIEDGAVTKERTGPREVTIEPRQPKQAAAA